jgi:hypothetical protein
MDWEKIKVGSWGAVGGAIVAVYVGFNFGGWMTNGAAGAMAKENVANAVAERLGTICVAQLNRDTDKGQKLKEMKEKDTWDKGRYIEKQSWAIMPGEDKPDSGLPTRAPSNLRRKHNKPRPAIAGQSRVNDNGIGSNGAARLTLSYEFLMAGRRGFFNDRQQGSASGKKFERGFPTD